MIERARRDYPAMAWAVGDIETWTPDRPLDLIFSNAALHWVNDHAELFGRLRSFLAERGVLAVQMPDNWNAPTHHIPAEVLNSGDWANAARASLMHDRLSQAEMYSRWVQPATVDMWRTTYFQKLSGDDPVWTWVTGSFLRPVLANLEPADRDRFSRRCRSLYREAYPAEPDGTTTLPFSRFFMIAKTT
jgi:trans-aconitate 2-methyltransferase